MRRADDKGAFHIDFELMEALMLVRQARSARRSASDRHFDQGVTPALPTTLQTATDQATRSSARREDEGIEVRHRLDKPPAESTPTG
jgi:hypothetical protein